MVFSDKRVLVTGGTGTLGKTIIKRLLSGKNGKPKSITVFSRDETKQNDFRIELSNKKNSTDEIIYSRIDVKFVIGDIRDFNDVCNVLQNKDIVINAAALKQVPTCEYFPEQALKTNCIGAINIVNAIKINKLPVETVVGVSTDKACKPISLMGITKAMQERIFISANIDCPTTRFVCVRYGNVIASRGSVIPLFQYQIENGFDLTITDEEMTRFLFTVDQAVDVVVEVIKSGFPGEICVPEIKSSKITDITDVMIGEKKIKTKVIGIRPGEKLHEIMISEEEARNCRKHNGYYFISPLLTELRINKGEFREYSSKNNLISKEQLKEVFLREGYIK